MKTSSSRFLGAALSLLVLAGSCGSPAAAGQAAPADLVLVGGKVFTAERVKSQAEAVAIRGGRIVAVGASAEIESLVGPKTRRVDLKGRRVVPGFNDAHFHFAPDPEGYTLLLGTLEPSWKETSEAIRRAVGEVPPRTWIFGRVGRDVVLDTEVTRFALDRLAPAHPVLLRSYYGHGYVLDSQAMPLLGIAEEEPDPAGGIYERVARSRLINGRLWEYAEWKPNRVLVERVPDEAAILALRGLARDAVRFGITSMQVFPSMPVGRFATLLARADLPIRIRAIAFPPTTPSGRDLFEIRGIPKPAARDAKVTASGMKWILDGTPIERGAALRRDYADRPGWRGTLNFPESEIASMARESIRFDQQLLVHAVGDRTIEAVLTALEGAAANADWPRRRVRIEHGDGLVGDLTPRARALGVIVVQNPTHFSEPALFRQRWGGGMFRLRSLLESGIPIALGSDGAMNPYLNLLLATTHPYDPKEALTREEAVRAYTYGSAFAELAENEKGTIEVGKLADLAILSQDILDVPAAELPKSVLTIVGGKVVYESASRR